MILMKKLFISLILVFVFLAILLLSVFIDTPSKKEVVYKDFSEIILKNSSWVNLEKSDLNSIILLTYSDNVLRIIDSLENSIPVIFEVNGGKFSKENKNNFIVASSLASSNTAYIYVPDTTSEYTKLAISLEELLENATRFFIINDKEVLE